MSTQSTQLFILVITLLFSSCSYVYFPADEVNDLKLNEKNDFSIAINSDPDGFTRKGGNSLRNLQVGYSPLNHLGIFASNFKNHSGGTISENNKTYNKVGLGTYFFHKKKKRKIVEYDFGEDLSFVPGLLIDFYTGIGSGELGFESFKLNFDYQFSFRKYFTQTGLHWQGRIGGLSFFYNFGKTNFHKGNANGKVQGLHSEIVNTIIQNTSFTTHDFTVNGNLGIKYARVYVNVNAILNDFDNLGRKPYYSSNLGVALNIDEVFKTIKRKKEL